MTNSRVRSKSLARAIEQWQTQGLVRGSGRNFAPANVARALAHCVLGFGAEKALRWFPLPQKPLPQGLTERSQQRPEPRSLERSKHVCFVFSFYFWGFCFLEAKCPPPPEANCPPLPTPRVITPVLAIPITRRALGLGWRGTWREHRRAEAAGGAAPRLWTGRRGMGWT